MAEGSNNRWVVLLNRSPKGPLSEEEVKSLLEQGLLRMNDIAYQVSTDGPKGDSEWKLLWQFSEFNRRREDGSPEESKKHPSAKLRKKPNDDSNGPTEILVPERRQNRDPNEIKQVALSEISPDLLEIAADDLVPKATRVTFDPEPQAIEPDTEAARTQVLEIEEEKLIDTAEPHYGRRVAAMVVGALVVSYLSMRWIKKRPGEPFVSRSLTQQPAPQPNRPQMRIPDFHGGGMPGRRPGGRPSLSDRPSAPPPQVRVEEGSRPPPPEPEPDRRDERELANDPPPAESGGTPEGAAPAEGEESGEAAPDRKAASDNRPPPMTKEEREEFLKNAEPGDIMDVGDGI